MKYYKKVDYEWLQRGLSDIADIIREKLKIENQKFSFPEGYKTILKEKLGNSDVEDALIEGTLAGIYENSRIKQIRPYTFASFTELTEVKIPSVTHIGEYAFAGCENLSKIEIPDSVIEIGEYAFVDCNQLTIFTNNNYVRDYAAYYGIPIQSLWSEPDYDNIDTLYRYELITTDNDKISVIVEVNPLISGDIKIPEKFGEEYPTYAIDEYAFFGCTNLTGISIPETVQWIGQEAFCDCTSLETIELPQTMMSIDGSTFNNTAYYNDPNNWSDEEVLYIDNHLIQAKNTISNEYTIKDNTLTIAGCAFDSCESLESIKCSDNLLIINYGAFYNCKLLKSIEFNKNLEAIDSWAFEGCVSLENITIPDKVYYLGDDVFSGCSSLTSITIPDSVTYIGDYAFNDCPNLTIYCYEGSDAYTYAMDNGIPVELLKKSTEESYFTYAVTDDKATITGFDSTYEGDVIIPDTLGGYPVVAIGYMAFYECDKITRVTVPDGVTNIDEEAFAYCSSLIEIDMPKSLKTIGYRAFIDCIALEKINGELSLEYLEDEAFYDCNNLTEIKIVSMVTTINDNHEPFIGCDKLTIYCYHSSDIHDHALRKNLNVKLIPTT